VSTDADLDTFRAFVGDFELYLKSETVYWTVRANLPALTIGGLLLLRRTLGAYRSQMSDAEADAFDVQERLADAVFARWPVNIEKKALKEFGARLSQWAGVLDELGDGYSTAVTPRVHLGLLTALVSSQPEAGGLQKRLAALDIGLRARLQPGDFVWAADLAGAFPRDEFWFLYGRPPSSP
jgi:hypothetical protein